MVRCSRVVSFTVLSVFLVALCLLMASCAEYPTTLVVKNASTEAGEFVNPITVQVIRISDGHVYATADIGKGKSKTWTYLETEVNMRVTATDRRGHTVQSSPFYFSGSDTYDCSYTWGLWCSKRINEN